MVLLSTDSVDYVGQVVERAESPSRTPDGGRLVRGGGTVLGKIREGAVTALARGESFERATIGRSPERSR